MNDARRLPFNAISKSSKECSVPPALQKCAIPGQVSIHVGCSFDFTTSEEFQAELNKACFPVALISSQI
jgi:hypothetical protein